MLHAISTLYIACEVGKNILLGRLGCLAKVQDFFFIHACGSLVETCTDQIISLK